jgi:hypothetical protein
VSEISGAYVDWGADPAVDTRVLWIPDTFIEASVQDILDTCRGISHSVSALDKPRLVQKAGGEEQLRGGVNVGLTVTLWNTQVAAEARTTPDSTGTVTTQSVSGTDLYDSSGTFETDSVERGAIIINKTDGSKCTVLRVVSETHIRCTPLSGGGDDQFDVSDSYEIINIVVIDISGGNLVSRTYADVEMGAVLGTFGTQINLAASSSATNLEEEAIQFASYGGGVSVDVINGQPGTTYPLGNQEFPCDNIADALTIASTRGFHTIFVRGDLTLDTGHDITDKCISGQNPVLSTITINAGATCLRSTFRNATIQGVLDGDSLIEECSVINLTYVEGLIKDSRLHGTITLGGTADTSFIDCASGVPGSNTPVIDANGGGQDFAFRRYSGGIKIINCSAPTAISIDLVSGHAILDSTVTDGDIRLRGMGEKTDNSGGTAVVTSSMISPALVDEALTAAHGSGSWQGGPAGGAVSIGGLIAILEALR